MGKNFLKFVVLPAVLLGALLIPSVAQRPLDDFGNFRQRRRATPSAPDGGASFGEYTFVRTIYDSPQRGYGRRMYGNGTWTTDYPEADNNFIVGLREWAGTNLKIAPRPEALEILDDRIFDYPILYIVEPGFMELSTEQAARLREYLTRGGFLYLDDGVLAQPLDGDVAAVLGWGYPSYLGGPFAYIDRIGADK